MAEQPVPALSVPSRLAAPSSGGLSSAAHGTAMTHQEVEFIAEEELVTIVPAFTSPRLQLLGGEVGPFRAQIPVKVPLWAAVALRSRNKASIVPPEWLEPAALEEVLRQERESASFQPLPFHYIEIATVLFKNAGDAFGDRRQRVQDLFESIRSVRFSKLESSMRDEISGNIAVLFMTNVSAMELNVLRPFLMTVLNRFSHHEEVKGEAARAGEAATATRAAAERGAPAGERRQLRR